MGWVDFPPLEVAKACSEILRSKLPKISSSQSQALHKFNSKAESTFHLITCIMCKNAVSSSYPGSFPDTEEEMSLETRLAVSSMAKLAS